MPLPYHTNIPLDEDRILLSPKLAPEWQKDDRLLFAPMAFKRDVYLPSDLSLRAWAIIHKGAENPEWSTVLTKANEAGEIDIEASYRLLLCQEAAARSKESGKQKYWAITVPQFLRECGAFPMAKDELVGVSESWGVAIWSKDALARYLGALAASPRK